MEPRTVKLLSDLSETLNEFSKMPDGQPAKYALHEAIGIVLAKQLAAQLRHRVAEADFKTQKSTDNSKISFCAFLLEIATDLLRGPAYPITASAIKGTIDADRLDFTKRDGVSSGLFQSGIDYDRLFALYSVRKKESDAGYWITLLLGRYPTLKNSSGNASRTIDISMHTIRFIFTTKYWKTSSSC